MVLILNYCITFGASSESYLSSYITLMIPETGSVSYVIVSASFDNIFNFAKSIFLFIVDYFSEFVTI